MKVNAKTHALDLIKSLGYETALNVAENRMKESQIAYGSEDVPGFSDEIEQGIDGKGNVKIILDRVAQNKRLRKTYMFWREAHHTIVKAKKA